LGLTAALIFLGLLLIVLAVLVVAYLLMGLRIRILGADPTQLESRPILIARQLRAWLTHAMWYLSASISLVAFLILAASLFEYFSILRVRNDFSTNFARSAITEQYSSIAVEPRLLLSASDELTPAGLNPLPGEAFIVTASLKDSRNQIGGCTPAYLQRLVNASTMQLRTSGFAVSGPSIYADVFKARHAGSVTAVCGVKWEWVVSTPATAFGPMSAFVELAYRENRSLKVYRIKPLHFAITPVPAPDITASVTSFAVALLSLIGVLTAAWLNSRKS
jgi:hypothetical protein